MSPDPVALPPEEPVDLAAEVTALRADIAALSTDLKDVVWGVTQEIDALRTDAEAARGELAESSSSSPATSKQAPAPRPWGATATVEDWRTLVEWVDWLSATYDTNNIRRISPCWPVHSGVVHELAALRSAWLRPAAAPEPDDALAYWHDRLLWPLLMRLSEYRISACVEGHKDVRPPRLTNRDVLEQVLKDVPVTADDDDERGVDTATGEIA